MSVVSLCRGTGKAGPRRGFAAVFTGHIRSLLAVALALVFANTSLAVEPTYSFDIPRQIADGALTALGEQADISVLYQYEMAVQHETNRLHGKYTLAEAIVILLRDSGLQAEFGEAGHLIIHQDGEQNAMTNQSQTPGHNASGRKSFLQRMGTAVTAAIFATSGAGAIAAEEAEDTWIEEIVVTAVKREMNLQRTPVAVSAFNAEALDKQGIQDISSLQFSVPGFSVQSSRFAPFITLRGVSQENNASGGSESGIAFHVDGVYQARMYGAGMAMFDMERVEVLRGPQGTLYGKNATGGVINYITKKPTDEFAATFDILGGNYDRVVTRGAINLPISDGKAALRFSWLTEERDGYYDNIWRNESVGAIDTKSYRAHLRLNPTDDVEIMLSASKEDVGGDEVLSLNFGTMGFGLPEDPDPFKLRSDTATYNDNDFTVYSAKVTWDLGNIVFSSLSAVSDIDFEYLFDFDATELNVADLLQKQASDQVTQELQLMSDTDNSLQWIVGLYYLNEENSLNLNLPGTAFFNFGRAFQYETTSYAVFSEVTYSLTEKLSLTGGLRYTEDEKDVHSDLILPPEFGGFTIPADFALSWDEVTGKIGVEYVINEDRFLYGSISRGYKAGGIANTNDTFDPEYIVSYEVGSKNQFMDGRAQVNVSAYFSDYKDMQVRRTFQSDGAILGKVENAAEASIAGLEVDFKFFPTKRFEINGSIALTNAEFDKFSSIDSARPDFAELGLQNLKGNKIQRVPDTVFKLGAQYTFDLGTAGYLTPRIDYYWKDKDYFTFFNRSEFVVPSSSRTNVRLKFESLDGRWYVDAFMLYLEDDDDIVFQIPHFLSPETGIEGLVGPPKTYGVRFGLEL